MLTQLQTAENAIEAKNIQAIFIFFGTNDYNAGCPLGE